MSKYPNYYTHNSPNSWSPCTVATCVKTLNAVPSNVLCPPANKSTPLSKLLATHDNTLSHYSARLRIIICLRLGYLTFDVAVDQAQ